MKRYNRHYEDNYPMRFRVDYVTIMCMLDELWEAE